MRRITAAVVVTMAALCLTASAGLRAQERPPAAAGRPNEVVMPVGTWRDLLASGRGLPPWERLVVVDRDGHVVRVVEGAETSVMLPLDLHQALSAGRLGATLVHNHVVARGFSCADFRQLATRGVIGVVAVGNDGSVFETGAGAQFDPMLFDEDTCQGWLARVSDRLTRETGQPVGERSELGDQIPHLFATALFRLGVIEYRTVPAVRARLTQFQQARPFDRVVDQVAVELANASGRATSALPPEAGRGAATRTLSSPAIGGSAH